MSSVLWLLLTIGVSSLASEEISNSIPALRQFDLADVIYKKQKDCDAIVGEAVVKALDKGDSYEPPVPDESYFQCKKILDEKKREYIKEYLDGIQFHPKSFPIVLPNRQTVTLAAPGDETMSSEADRTNFNIQDELCVTNDLCITLDNLKVSNDKEQEINEKKKNVSRCLDFLNDLKLKYLKVLNISEKEIETILSYIHSLAGGFPVVCTYGELTFTLPKKRNVEDIVPSVEPEKSINSSPAVRHDNQNKQPVVQSAGPLGEDNDEKHNANEEVTDKKPKYGITTEDVRGIETKKAQADVENDDVKTLTMKFLESERRFATDSSKIEINDKASPHKKELDQNIERTSENIKKETEDTKPDAPTPVEKNDEPEPSLDKKEEASNENKNSTNKKHKKRKPKNTNEDEKVELVTYHVNVVSKHGDGKVTKINASGQIKKTETVDPKANLQERISPARDDMKPSEQLEHELEADPVQVFEERKIQHLESLEDSIIFMENDCKELLQFGEQLMKHKMLSSLINFENHYNECIEKLNDLKKMYIRKRQLDVKLHKNIFPLTLPSGDQKLIALPSQFLNTDSAKTESSLNTQLGSTFDTSEFFREKEHSKTAPLTREPFDDPEFIPNYEFLESLQRDTSSSESSALSKVASILHMNGRHGDKEDAQ